MRSFQLPQGIDTDQIKAEFNNGVLTLHIPKAALPQPKRISISATGQQRQQASIGSGNPATQQSGGNQRSTAKSSGNQGDSPSQRERMTADSR
jgi:hypothetical protein